MKKIFSFIAIFFLAISLVACNGTNEIDGVVADAFKIYNGNDDASSVTKDLNLRTTSTKVDNVTIIWFSDNYEVITNEGLVNRPEGNDVNVSLTFTVEYKNQSITHSISVTVKAIEEIKVNLYNVTLEGQGLSSSHTIDIEEDLEVTITISAPSDKVLNQLIVNDIDVTSEVTNNTYTFLIKSDTIIKATYNDVIKHQITFDSNEGTAVDSIEVKSGYTVDLLEKPSRAEFIFIGWFLDEQLTNRFIEGVTLVNSDLVLYASWSNETIKDIHMIGSTIHWEDTVDSTYEVLLLGQLRTLTVPSFDVSQYKDQLKAKGVKVSTIVDNVVAHAVILYVTYEDGIYLSAQEGDSSNLTGYYASANGLYGDELVYELQSIITNTMQAINYGDVRYMLEKSDVHPTRPNELSLIYNNVDFNGRVPYAKPIWDQGNTWNREHTWPQSKLAHKASNGSKNQASDAHNLRAIDNPVNSHRGNRYFNERQAGVTNPLGDWSGSGYYPGDIDKGDVARIMMYMALRYEGSIHLTNNIALLTGDGLYSGKLEYFYDWHFEDGVDAFEIRRNDIIYDHQKNRNPFIDHPEVFKPVFDYYTELDSVNN